MKEITDKMNAIELQTRELLERAKFLEDQRDMMVNLMDCSVHDHQWVLRNVVSDLTTVFQFDIECERCGVFAYFGSGENMHVIGGRNHDIRAVHVLKIRTQQGAPLSDLVGEEE